MGIVLIYCHAEHETAEIQDSDLNWFHGKGQLVFTKYSPKSPTSYLVICEHLRSLQEPVYYFDFS